MIPPVPESSANTPQRSRRTFLQQSAEGLAAGLAAAWWTAVPARLAAQSAAGPLSYDGLETVKYLGDVKTETRVPTEKFFTESPAVDASGDVFFTNVPTPATAQILRWNPAKKTLVVFREPSHAANGLFFDSRNRLLACEGGEHDKGRLTRTEMVTGQITILVDNYQGKPLGAPNDVVLDRRGRIYFTSRVAQPDVVGNDHGVYRVDADGSVHKVLSAPELHMPNGLDFSPDEKTFYLIEADGRANRNRSIKAYDVQPDGGVTNGRVLVNLFPGRSGDGMSVDAEGNLYVAAGLHKTRGTTETLATKPGIHVFSPQGKLVAFRETPVDTITNCTFGGDDLRTLYVACGPFLLSLRTSIPGKAIYRPPGGVK